MKPQKWTVEDKKTLSDLVQISSKKPDWTEIAKYFTNRTPKQCYDCFTLLNKSSGLERNYTKWTDDEENRLIEFIENKGINWAKLQKEQFPNRSISQLKNKYRITTKKYIKPSETDNGTQQDSQKSNEEIVNQLKKML
ncbi:Myb-like_DNA-binding domain-containing protein [Hexamita inflata]|uniref:Myb-like DNA-binding domain-containing protein n=1 Tax=Hexamita inflata TaxID=28002 RepID=A0AA86PTW1_9EUKA|nr:Myb-like DNA-binding domain-containing protein [Hexamita inflata]